jgi:exonuclease SbcD
MSGASPFLRLIHTSDWHIGHELHGHGREEEHDTFLAWLLEELVTREADALVVTGDIYDVANPPTAAMARFYSFLREALSRCPGLAIVVIGGNHDSAARVNLPGELLGAGRVRLVGQLPRRDGALDLDRILIPLPDKGGTVAAWLAAIPYCRPGDLGQGDLETLYAEVASAGIERAGGLPLVLTGHLHVAGGEVSVDSERRIVVGGEEAQPSRLFDAKVGYVALGHLHRPQLVPGATTIRYAGSPFPMSASERDYRHSICVVDLGGGGSKVEEIPIPRIAEFLALPKGGAKPIGEVETLLREMEFPAVATPGTRPFLEVSVLLDRPEPGITARVQEALDGKPVRLTRVRPVYPEGAGQESIAARAEALDELSPGAVFAELHSLRHGAAPEPELAEVFARLLIEVEAEDPA